jgi:hypothetical protein
MKRRYGTLFGGLAFIVILVGAIAFGSAYYSTVEDVRVTVTDKERVCSRDGDGGTSCQYLVFTEGEVFANRDSLIFTKWNSSDVQGRLREGGTYDVRVAGWRVPLFSAYRNIIEVKG